jgi:hypothetical protein
VLGEAITALRNLQQFHLRSAEEIENMLLRIRDMPSGKTEYKETETKYKGCNRKLALRMYFKDRKERRIPIETVAQDFLRLGVAFTFAFMDTS